LHYVENIESTNEFILFHIYYNIKFRPVSYTSIPNVGGYFFFVKSTHNLNNCEQNLAILCRVFFSCVEWNHIKTPDVPRLGDSLSLSLSLSLSSLFSFKMAYIKLLVSIFCAHECCKKIKILFLPHPLYAKGMKGESGSVAWLLKLSYNQNVSFRKSLLRQGNGMKLKND
jgi:hypothetical protein